MSQSKYLTAPVPSTKMPAGIPYIIGNEAAERFSFYGMRALLVTFMTKFLYDAAGNADFMTEPQARKYFHLFVASAYFFPLFGAILSDVWVGKYRTILILSIVYCFGHLALALDDTRVGLIAGLGLIAIGSGGIKPCVSAHVGDQFGKSNAHLLEKVFGWFYLAINLGAFLSTLLTPWLLNSAPTWIAANFPQWAPSDPVQLARLGPHLAFGVPGLLMLLATIVFWMGRHVFVHIPPQGAAPVFRSITGEGGWALLRLIPLYLFVAVFWSLYDQSGSSWVLQADKMDRRLAPGWNTSGALGWLGQDLHTEQIQAINPFLILVLVPLFAYVIYPLAGKFVKLTPLRKVGAGFFATFAAFVIASLIQESVDAGGRPTVYWQFLAYVILTAGEVMVSVTCLEYSYTQAPREMKSFIMALYLPSVSLGNILTSVVNDFIENPDGTSKLEGAAYYWFFTKLMLGSAVIFIPIASFFREKTYLQEERPAPPGFDGAPSAGDLPTA
ncbi:MAG: MFS transporter [Planctomycetaceae bacterium]|nr:MAG: MFS transporter [Planctomycetaceae bacterium]